jgi:hypothetical protein
MKNYGWRLMGLMSCVPCLAMADQASVLPECGGLARQNALWLSDGQRGWDELPPEPFVHAISEEEYRRSIEAERQWERARDRSLPRDREAILGDPRDGRELVERALRQHQVVQSIPQTISRGTSPPHVYQVQRIAPNIVLPIPAGS